MLKVNFKDKSYEVKHFINDTNVDEFFVISNIANKEVNEDYDWIDKQAEVIESISDFDAKVLEAVPVLQINDIFNKCSTEFKLEFNKELNIDGVKFTLINECDSFEEFEILRGQYKTIRNAMKNTDENWIPKVLKEFYETENEEDYQLLNKTMTKDILHILTKIIETVAIQENENIDFIKEWKK